MKNLIRTIKIHSINSKMNEIKSICFCSSDSFYLTCVKKGVNTWMPVVESAFSLNSEMVSEVEKAVMALGLNDNYDDIIITQSRSE